jgi:hypothetical protein
VLRWHRRCTIDTKRHSFKLDAVLETHVQRSAEEEGRTPAEQMRWLIRQGLIATGRLTPAKGAA